MLLALRVDDDHLRDAFCENAVIRRREVVCVCVCV